MRSDTQAPIIDSEAEQFFAVLKRYDHVVLAVSGGADSMALLTLSADWKRRSPLPSPEVSVATVDHGLRAVSRDEAQLVARESERLGLRHTILTWDGEKPETGLPQAARDARYRLLSTHARGFGAARIAIATAHHRDDQAETFAMRLARGAGIDGLSGMRGERLVNDGSPIVLVRPFLEVPKARLVATVASRGIPYVDDPTNVDQRYERARVRSLLPDLEAAGMSAEALATSARRLNDAREALDYADDRFTESLDLSFGNEVFAQLDRRAFENGPAFLRQRIISRLISRYGGDSPKPQLFEIEDLVARMQREGGSCATLGGTMISCGRRFIRVWREAGRLNEREVELVPGEARVWDGRFVVAWSADQATTANSVRAAPVIVKPLGKNGYAAIVTRLLPGRKPPARAALALPSFWAGDEIIAAPSLAPFALLDAPRLDPEGFELTPLAKSVSH